MEVLVRIHHGSHECPPEICIKGLIPWVALLAGGKTSER